MKYIVKIPTLHTLTISVEAESIEMARLKAEEIIDDPNFIIEPANTLVEIQDWIIEDDNLSNA